jgi:hypothetical protein
MKKVIFISMIIFLIGSSCKEKIDIDKEKQAIMAVIEEETASYYASDFERWSATQIQDSNSIRMGASRTGYSYTPGWQSISSVMKPGFLNERAVVKQIKTPMQFKIYEETAWVLFNNESYNNNGVLTGNQLVTNFLEKHDGKWKMVYRNTLGALSYSQAETFLINSINYAKSLGKSVEDIAGFTADQYKTGWSTTNGYTGIVNNWRTVVPNGELQILEQDDNHIIFSANNMFSALKRGAQYNVSYDDYLLFYRVVFERVADYLGFIYKQETTADGVLVTISKK